PPNQQQHQQHHNLHSQHPHAPPTHPSLAPVSGLLSSLYSAGNSGVGVGSLGLTPQAAEAYFAGLGAPAGIAAFPGLSTPTPTSTPPPAPQQSTNKQKKRGKKHRHANTSSGATAAAHASVSANLNAGAGVNPSANYTGNFNMSMNSFGLGLGSGTGNGNGNGFSAGSGGVVVGGGVVDLADPSILQARMHPSSSLSVQQQAQSHTGQSHTGQSQPRQQQQAQAHPHAQHHVQMSPNSFAGLYGGGHAAAGGYHGSSQSHPPAGADELCFRSGLDLTTVLRPTFPSNHRWRALGLSSLIDCLLRNSTLNDMQSVVYTTYTVHESAAPYGLVDEDFPPLEPPSAKLSEGIRSPIDSFRLPSHSRVSLDDVSCSRRSSTPKVPPGFTASHAQSINVALFDSPTPSHSSTAVTINNENLSQAQSPALGAATTNQAAIEPVKGIAKDANARGTNAQQFVQQTTSNGEKGLDSNKELLVQKAKEQEEKKEEVKIKGVAKQHEQLGSTKEKEWHEKLEKPRKSSEGHVKQKPIKLNLATGMPITPIEQHSPRVASPATHPLTASSIAAGSHPATPLISAKIAEVTSVQVPQKARVLRLVDTPKSEPSVSTSFSSTTTSVQGHEPAPGRPSVSSATPAEANSEYAPSLASATASRASSPPPSRIGSAPVRSMTKNQQKKERRMKAAKQVEAKTGEGTVAQQEEPEQAPIISRKRKTKKIPESSVSSKTDASAKVEKEKDRQKKKEKEQEKQEKGKESKTVKENEGSKQVAQQGMVKEPREVVNAKETVSVSATPKRSDSPGPEGEPAWASNNTFEQLFHDCEITGDSIKHCFIERLPALADIYTDMHMAGELDINAPLHNPPPLSLRTDIKCSAADFAKIRLPIRLTSEHRKMLSKGHPVRINSDSEDPKGRCLITPGGTVLRHLSAADEDRYLQLEKEIALTDDLEYWKDFPTDEITEPDISNRGGSLETIFANPERFNIQWVDDETEAMTPVPDSATDASALRAPFSGFFTAAGLSGLSQHLSDFAKGLAGLPGAQAKIDALRQAAGIPVADGALSELP
ncbi:CCR4-NOT transcription complex subunit 4, partial [Ascosphaera aggregata]